MNAIMTPAPGGRGLDRVAAPALDVVIPVYNEQATLARSVEKVHAALSELPYSFRITIADNASTDDTAHEARALSARFDKVRALVLEEKGRGRALRHAWTRSDADVLVYMDVDLSTDLDALLPLVAPLLTGHSDIAIGSRLARGSRITRGPKREFISRSYNVLLRSTLRVGFSDAQCGFKAIRRDVAELLLPLVEDENWFFDTELLVLAERAGLRIHEVPVDWVDDPDSRVDIVSTAVEDLRGVWRLGTGLVAGRIVLNEVTESLGRTARASAGGRINSQIAIFAIIGVLSTLAYSLLYLLARQPLGPQAANITALVITAIANTAANRRFTFGVRGKRRAWTHQLQGLLIFAAGVAATSLALWGFHRVAGTNHPITEMLVLTATNLGVTAVRFIAMRCWIFRRR